MTSFSYMRYEIVGVRASVDIVLFNITAAFLRIRILSLISDVGRLLL